MISTLILLPLLTALALVFVPRDVPYAGRAAALAATLVTLILSLVLFLRFETGQAGFQFVQKVVWIQNLHINYHVGVDGVNIGLLLMGAIVAFAATCVSWEIKHREKEFYILLLLMTGGILGAFASLDLFFFYFFHELALVPTFLMIGVWGRGEQKNFATFQITIYLTLGALIALVGLILLYVQAGAASFDIVEITERLRHQPMSASAQRVIFPFLLFGFGILVSLWPFHSWAPLGYASAPTATAMLHAGVLKKFGLYGLIRVALPMVPEGARGWMHVLAWLCLGNILYCGLVAMRQRDLNLLIGNSSVAHMGFAFLGIASLSWIGVTGAVVVMIAHGLLAALCFGLNGYLYQRAGHLDLDKMGGLLKTMPFVGTVMIMAMLAGCGLPGFANFAGEIMVLFGAWNVLPGFVAAAAWGALIIGAVYMLRTVRTLWHGPAPELAGPFEDPSLGRRLPFLLLLAALLVFGIFPSLLTEKIKPSTADIVQMATKPAPVESAPVLAKSQSPP